MLTEWAFFGIGLPPTILGMYVVTDEVKAFRAARYLFWFSALWMWGKIMWWGFNSVEGFLYRSIAVFIACGLIGIGLTEALRLTARREAYHQVSPAPPPDVTTEDHHATPSPAPSASTENHGTTDKIETEVKHQATSDSVVPVVKKTEKSHQEKQIEQRPPIVQYPYGNLEQRCDALGNEIIELADSRDQVRPDRRNVQDYNSWYALNDGIYFHARYYDFVKDLQNRLLKVNIEDPQLDRLVKQHEDGLQRRQQNVEQAVQFPQAYHLSTEEIRQIGQRFKALAAQIRAIK